MQIMILLNMQCMTPDTSVNGVDGSMSYATTPPSQMHSPDRRAGKTPSPITKHKSISAKSVNCRSWFTMARLQIL